MARESGQVPARSKRRIAFPLGIAAIVVIGVLVVFLARRPASQPKVSLDTPADINVTPSTETSTTIAGSTDAVPTTLPDTPTTVAVTP